MKNVKGTDPNPLCPTCKGRKLVKFKLDLPFVSHRCADCNGTGKVSATPAK